MADTTIIAPPVAPVDTSTSSPSLIVTSGASRSNYSSNVSSLNAANTNLSTTQNNNPSVVDFLNTNGQASDYASRSKMAADMGIQNYTGSAAQNTQMLSALRAKSGGGSSDTKPDTTTTPPAKTDNPVTSVSSVTNPDGSKTDTNSDGSSTITGLDGVTYNLPKGVDPTVGKQLHDNEVQANKDVESASKVVDSAQALVNSDTNGTNPAAVAAANEIKAQFGILIDQMKQKNSIILGSATVNAARSGGLQYANDMTESFLGTETSKGLERIADLTSKMNSAIMKSNMAYASGDVKALDAAQKEYKDAKTAGQKALMDLQKTVNDAVKQNQTDIKTQITARNASIANDAKLATSNAQAIADTIKKAGITDQPTIDAYIQGMATKLGISNVTALQSAVTKAQQSTEKANLGIANTKDIMNKRGKNTPSSGKFVISSAIAAVTPQFEAVKGQDGYIDPQKWVAARTNWNKLGGTDASFNSNFKKYLNPESYSIAGFKPTSTTSGFK